MSSIAEAPDRRLGWVHPLNLKNPQGVPLVPSFLGKIHSLKGQGTRLHYGRRQDSRLRLAPILSILFGCSEVSHNEYSVGCGGQPNPTGND